MTLRRALPLSFCIFFMLSLCAVAQRNREDRATTPAASSDVAKSQDAKAAEPKPEVKPDVKKDLPEPPPVVTHHDARVGGKLLRYTATTGTLRSKMLIPERWKLTSFSSPTRLTASSLPSARSRSPSTAAPDRLPSGCTWEPSDPNV